MQIEWQLSCSVDEAIEIIRAKIDGPLVPPFMGKNFQGFKLGNSFTVWNKHEGIGNRTAVAKIILSETPNGCHVVARTAGVFPSNLAPSSPRFYYFAVPATIICWGFSVYSVVFDKREVLSFSFPLAGIGIVFMLLGFMKMMGKDNIKFLDKFLHNTLYKYKI